MKSGNKVLDRLLEMSDIDMRQNSVLIRKRAIALYKAFAKREKGKPRVVTMHTLGAIYPCISFYKAVSLCTGEKEQAYRIMENFFAERAEKRAAKIRKICAVPFVYRAVPQIVAKMIHGFFGAKSGFEPVDRILDRELCHIDMLSCPYNSICRACGCPELTKLFCASDDIAYGNMHKNLSWERTKTLGKDGDCCDFVVRVCGSKK